MEYGSGTDGGGNLGENSISNSSDGKEHGACATEHAGGRDDTNEIID